MEKKHATGKNNYDISYQGAALAKRVAFITKMVTTRAQEGGNDRITVLDIGCGLGTISFKLGSLGYIVTGLDLDDNTIDYCNEKNQFPNVNFITGDAVNLDLKQRYDVVIASEVIEHVVHPDMVINTMHRHLKEGGIGIISIPNGYCLWELMVSRFLQKSKLISWFYRSTRLHKLITGSDTPFYSKNIFCFHSHFFSFGRLKKLLAENGFKISIVSHSDLGILPEWSWLKFFKTVECKIAGYVPHALAGGWLLVIRQ